MGGRFPPPSASPEGVPVARRTPASRPRSAPPAPPPATVPAGGLTARLVRAQPWLSTAARLFLAGVFIWAGWPKLIDGEGTVRSVRAFQLVPEVMVRPFAYALPMVELVIAVLLIIG